MCDLSISECADFLQHLTLDPRQQAIAGQVLKEILSRLGFLLDVGLDYLSLSRPAATLAAEKHNASGWPHRSVRPGGVLYVLDEPSIGLHQRDNRRLIETLTRLRDLGNTLIVVEHDLDTIAHADWIVDIGPGQGSTAARSCTADPTTNCCATRTRSPAPTCPVRKVLRYPRFGGPSTSGAGSLSWAPASTICAASTYPSARGVHLGDRLSGSGKSTLVNDILAAVLANKLNGARQVPAATPGSPGSTTSTNWCKSTSRRSDAHPAPTRHLHRVFDKIRTLFAATTEAKVRGYQPGRFSFNVKGAAAKHVRVTAPSKSK
ncbi:uvrABC system A domain protein [Mycobacterium xenopi 4042]|uniref:UvrABC system protein A n=1 Tax=Mycobacterium xenopi 4042 TaxID=1299334 RepID=X8AW87_MYCXE|nr:uvrABC system A domain protein [Mycobacterium xenopi 4042]